MISNTFNYGVITVSFFTLIVLGINKDISDIAATLPEVPYISFSWLKISY
jgi:hypothetical protein